VADKNNAGKIGCGIVIAICVAIIMFCEFVLPETPKSAAAITARSASDEGLSVLFPSCAPGGRISCDDDLYQKKWLRLEADNGEFTKVDTNFRRSNVGSVEAIIYTYTPADTMFDPSRLRRLLFDCIGHYMDVTGPMGPQMDAPPLSIAGRIAKMACIK
jgi:hypothetical protein